MDKNNTTALAVLSATITLFIGIFLGTLIGRTTGPNTISNSNYKNPPETMPTFTYPFKTNVTGKININIATEEELIMLPGIGKETASRIIEYRSKYGIFYSLDELAKIKGISNSTVEKLRSYATTGD